MMTQPILFKTHKLENSKISKTRVFDISVRLVHSLKWQLARVSKVKKLYKRLDNRDVLLRS